MTKYAPHTSTSALVRAKAKVGKSNQVGMCAHEVIVNILGIPAPWKWGGDGKAYAINYFLGSQKVVHTTDPAKVPAGAVVIWGPRKGATTVGGKAGHIAIGAGGGYCYSTDLPVEGKWGKVKITSVTATWGKPLVGYVLVDGMGYTLTDPPAKSQTAVWDLPSTWEIGSTGDAVTKLGKRLVVWAKHLKLAAPYKTGPGPEFTETDRKAVAAFQKAQGWTGKDADGYPGAETFKRLAAEPATPKTVTLSVLFLPMAGYNDDTAKGVTRWQANTDGLAALVNKHKPDFVATTELSNRSHNKMLPRFDKALPGYSRDASGSDGRYVYRNKATTNNKGSGVVQAAKATLLNGDTKQAAWSANDIERAGIKVGVIAAHTENQDGVDKASKKDANDLRPEQMDSFIDKGARALRLAGVTEDHIIVVADTNSESKAKDHLVDQGWNAIGPGYFTRWDDSAKKTFDWGFIRSGTATFERINHDFGDHTALLITWTIPV